MNLPIFNPIQSIPLRSSYYTFSKALKDFDASVMNNSPYFFSKMVALNLPFWKVDVNPSSPDNSNNPSLSFRFRKSTSNPSGDIVNYSEILSGFPEVDNESYVNPNRVIPLVFQYYMENIIRQTTVISDGNPCENIVELAFWKTLNLLGLDKDNIFGNSSLNIPSVVTFANNISTSNFINVSNNQGWCEIIASIPNKCPFLDMNEVCWKNIVNVNDIVYADVNNDNSIYDSNQMSFAFDFTNFKKVLNFDTISKLGFDFEQQSSFRFNTLLIFYKDQTGVDKLHGINFLFPFVNDTVNTNVWTQQTFHHNSNVIQTFGYSFKFNMKSVNNDATISEVYSHNEGTFWQALEVVMGNFNSFLELQKKQGSII